MYDFQIHIWLHLTLINSCVHCLVLTNWCTPLVLEDNSSQRHRWTNNCDRHTTHHGGPDLSSSLSNISSQFIFPLHLECYLLYHKRLIKISK